MVDLDIHAIVQGVKEALTEAERQHVAFKNRADDGHPDSGAAFFIEGTYCSTSIGVWPQGLCDVDWLYVSDKKGHFVHREFFHSDEPVPCVVAEIRNALERERSKLLAYGIH